MDNKQALSDLVDRMARQFLCGARSAINMIDENGALSDKKGGYHAGLAIGPILTYVYNSSKQDIARSAIQSCRASSHLPFPGPTITQGARPADCRALSAGAYPNASKSALDDPTIENTNYRPCIPGIRCDLNLPIQRKRTEGDSPKVLSLVIHLLYRI